MPARLPAASAGDAQTTALTTSGPASLATANTYNAPKLGPASQAAQTTLDPTQTIHGESLLNNLGSYLDPTLQNLVDTTMASYKHDTAEQRAAEQAKLAGEGSWGSGGNFYMSNFDIDNLLKGAGLENQLRSQAWNTALNASNMDADRRQGASGFNAGAANTRSLNQGQLDASRNMFNTDALNNFKLSQAGFDSQAGQFNANAKNQVGMFNSGQQNDMSMFNTGQSNQVGMFNTGQQNTMAQYNAGLANDQLDRALQAAGMQGDIANSMGSNQRADVGACRVARGHAAPDRPAAGRGSPDAACLAGQMYGGLNLPGYFGQSTTSSPSPFNTALSIGALFASDRRLKTDIEEIGSVGRQGATG
jgi:hypothetical protein